MVIVIDDDGIPILLADLLARRASAQTSFGAALVPVQTPDSFASSKQAPELQAEGLSARSKRVLHTDLSPCEPNPKRRIVSDEPPASSTDQVDASADAEPPPE